MDVMLNGAYLAVLIVMLVTGGDAGAATLGLDEAIATALQKHPSLTVARESVNAGRAQASTSSVGVLSSDQGKYGICREPFGDPTGRQRDPRLHNNAFSEPSCCMISGETGTPERRTGRSADSGTGGAAYHPGKWR